MFEEWGHIEWLILAVDVLALYIVYRFLKSAFNSNWMKLRQGNVIVSFNEERALKTQRAPMKTDLAQDGTTYADGSRTVDAPQQP